MSRYAETRQLLLQTAVQMGMAIDVVCDKEAQVPGTIAVRLARHGSDRLLIVPVLFLDDDQDDILGARTVRVAGYSVYREDHWMEYGQHFRDRGEVLGENVYPYRMLFMVFHWLGERDLLRRLYRIEAEQANAGAVQCVEATP